jgi:lipoprotein-releasing system ATP-binding protein
LGTLDQPDAGSLIIDGQDVTQLGERPLATFRNEKIGFIFQFHNLLGEFSALENVCMPSFIGGKGDKAVRERAEELLVMLGLKDRINNLPSQMSGGEQQRTAVARALMNSPAIIFADEPSGNLDSKNAQELHELFFTLRDKFQQTFVVVTHNEELANMADRKLIMQDGLIIN